MQDAVEQFKGWYTAQPIFTRSFLTACVVETLLLSFGMVSPFTLLYGFRKAFFQLQLWRPFTALFFMGKFDFGFIFNIYFAYLAINKVETQVFSRERYADFLWLIVLLFGGCIVLGSIFNLVVFTEPFLMALVYVWCKRMPHEQIRVLFGLVVKTGYFPFVYAIMMTLFGGSLINYIIGIFLGHAYIFVKDIALVRYQRDYLPTPRWFSNWWHGRRGMAAPRNAPNTGGVFGGRGVRLD